MINDNKSIWNSKYVCKLGILDHCNELKIINNKIIELKNSLEEFHSDNFSINILENHFKKECADLFLILAAYLECEQDQQNIKLSEIIQQRENKFKEKSKE